MHIVRSRKTQKLRIDAPLWKFLPVGNLKEVPRADHVALRREDRLVSAPSGGRPRMTSLSPSATSAANFVWNERISNGQTPRATANAIVDLLSELRAGLGRWIGVAGYNTLLDRAVGIAREDYPWISALFQPEIEAADLIAAVESFGTPVVLAGGKQLIAVIIELLGRIVGINMAVHLVKHFGISSANPVNNAATEGQLDE